ncbi:hypothetical protein DFH09DRAFT_351098 [Mycena vulgaris]|nr:hypothetical protein DFH09DRAFT_351098 [Mycena vulgaris]
MPYKAFSIFPTTLYALARSPHDSRKPSHTVLLFTNNPFTTLIFNPSFPTTTAMYFHNAATHCCPRVSSAATLTWEPFHLSNSFRTPAVVRVAGRCLELYEGSEALPRPSRGRMGAVYFQPPTSSGGDDAMRYVLSWPPSIATPGLCPPCASPACSDSSSVYYTPPTTATFSPTSTLSTPPTVHSAFTPPRETKMESLDLIDLSDDENHPPLQPKFLRAKVPMCRPAGHRRRILQLREPRLTGWARLRRDAPPALRMAPIEQEVAVIKRHYVLEFGKEDGLVKPQANLRNTLEQRRRLLDLLVNGA